MTLKSIDLFILNISNKNRDNYTLMEGNEQQAVSLTLFGWQN
jgi:BarA-like signal transduction histidine kinase